MPRRARSSGTVDAPAKEAIVHEKTPQLEVSPAAEEVAPVRSEQKSQITEAAVKEPWHDLNIIVDVTDQELKRRDFVRIYAIKKNFSNVDFTHSNFVGCYFHACKFTNCNFTGVIFKETNFSNSDFEDCKFEYSQWDKTNITPGILDNCLPSWENVAHSLARALRVNFTQIGNLEGINKAAAIEVEQKGQMLYDAAFSRKRYYREKSKGLGRLLDAARFIQWKLLHYVWGNGESPLSVLVCTLIVITVTGLCHFSLHYQTISLWSSLLFAFSAFWGIAPPDQWSLESRLLLTVTRYVLFALFMASLIRRLSRR
jgi:hypothetical protein